MKRRSLTRLTLCAFLLLSLGVAARAQGTASRVTGLVTDQSGGTVPGATVTLTNEGTNVSFTTQTTDAGTYVFDSVQVGVYTVAVEKQGYSRFVSTSNQVNVNQPATVDAVLEVGGLTDVVTVEASAELVQTSTSGNIGNTVEQRSLEALPIVGERGRNPLQFVSLQPGVIGNGRAGTGGNTGGNVHVHGSRDRAFNFTLDGIDINESSAGGSNFTPLKPNPDSIEQFQVVTSNFTAELGRSSGAQVSLVTRSGTDEFHGTLFELYRTPRLNANEYENTLNGRGRGQFVQHIFGGSLGGPVFFPRFGEGGPRVLDGRKSKTYFFTNLQLLRASQSILVTRTVYTAQARQGLFRYRIGAANAPAGTPNPSVDAAGNVLPGVVIGTYDIVANDPLCNTQPGSCGLDPTTQALVNAAPLPNNFTAGDGLNTAGFSFGAPQIERQYDFVLKVDHSFNERNQIYVRYAQGEQNTLGDNGNAGLRSFPDSPFNRTDTFRNPKNLAVNWRTTPSASVTNEFVVGLSKFAFLFTNPDPNPVPFILNLPRDPFSHVPAIDNQRELTTWQFVDNVSFVRGAHTFRGGTNLRFQTHDDIRSAVGGFSINPQVNFSRTVNPPPNSGPFSFHLPAAGAGSISNGDRNNLLSAINDLLGRVGNIQQAFVAESDAAYAPGGTHFLYVSKYNEYDFYFQDTWRVRPNLVLDYGLRWEPKMSPRAGGDDVVLRPDRPVRLGEAPSNEIRFVEGKLFDDDWNNFAPSVGFAWDPFNSGKTSVRANYRLAYDRMNTFLASSAIFPNTPGTTLGINDTTFAARPNETGRVRFGIPRLAPAATPAQLRQPVPFSTASLTVFDPSTRFPKTNQWSVSVQREVGRGFVFEANYIGRKGVGLFGAYDVNQVNIFAQDPRCPGETFLDAFNTLRGSAGATSCLANTLFTGSPTNDAGSASFRSTFSSELNQGSVATAAFLLAQRNGGRLLTNNGFSPFFFQPYPQFSGNQTTGGLIVIDSNDFSTYHGLELQVSRRVGRGLLMQMAYTLSKSMDTRSFDPTFSTAVRTVSTSNASPSAQNSPLDIRDRRLNYARSDFDRRHALQGYVVYDLPFGRGQRFLGDTSGFVNQIVGGWEFANSLILQSGRPFTVYGGAFTVSNWVLAPADCDGCTPDMSGVVEVAGTNFIFSEDERALFSTPAPGELGNTGRNFFTGPKFFNLDMTVRKRFYFGERTNLEFRADINNLTNTPSFEFPIASTSSIGTQSPGFTGSASNNAAFGRIRDSVNSNSRRIQLGVKFNF
ncbi:MAG TPA: carboxypeptidase-like regulatory domain-containing protein [Pyrinomonadaceae bacterium]|nr:carboxypeptidase-like regulatory domain-containing protein [Pyrinomonadaceae bacterium]